ncbi:MAG: proton extrusion protein PcxA [Nostoc sp. CmiVER01]|uniref:proton extrusion protein PcxA n=1 Tax=Nostoc sp. CmiVER01 TaxID=3075384 RepID=UPI002AD335B2|nr:proton extrusion protein PcxA [Nostoc sp. CmiVER01]MDZ8126002.1 proton extrusion protein PcxA [Nostoc sp. CmiVER01]
MKNPFGRTANLFRQNLKDYLRSLNVWFLDTPERALLEAQQAAQRIKNIEIEHFDGKKISSQSVNYTENVMSYWQGYLDKNLTIIKLRLIEFRLSRKILNLSNSVLLENLKIIDEVVERYALKDEIISNNALISISQPLQVNQSEVNKQLSSNLNQTQPQPPYQQARLLSRSMGQRLNRIKVDFVPQTEEEFIRNHRLSKNRTKISIRFILTLIIVPFLTQQLSKNFLVYPILEKNREISINQAFLNSDMEKEALHELHHYQQILRFEYFLNQAPPISSEAITEKIKDRAIEIAEEFHIKQNSVISNVFADLISLISFSIIIIISKKEIVLVKSFLDNIVYGLSDSAKAFLIILSTDLFVGFHSPEGWEVILEGLAEHLGLPGNKTIVFFFIATFPVILNTIFKYWIFSYLSRLSPSALATLKEMDEGN